MRNIIVILVLIAIHSCDYIYCSDEKLSSLDEHILLELDKKYAEIEIYPDKCLPLGYYNVRVNNDSEIDTITLTRILDQTLQSNIAPDRMRVYGSEDNFKFILYKTQGKHLILLPSDL